MLYLLYGPDTYRRNERLREMEAAYCSKHPEALGITKIDGERDLAEIAAAFRSGGGLFEQKRFVVVRDAFRYHGEALTRMLETDAVGSRDDLNVLFVEGDIAELPGCDTFQSLCRSELFSALPREKLRAWIVARVREWGPEEGPKHIAPSAVALLMKAAEGGDLWRVASEVKKLLAYAAGRKEITEDDVLTMTRFSSEGTMFAVGDAMCERKPEQALVLVARLTADHEEYDGLIGYAINEARNLARARAALEEGTREQPKEFTANPYVWRKRMAQAKRWGSDEAAALLSRSRDLDVAWKTGTVDKRLALERFLLASSVSE